MTDAWVDGDSLAGVVLGLDAGTTSAKAVAVDRAGQILATAGSDPIATRSTPAGGSEQDPAEIWRALTTAGRQAVYDLGPGVRVAALAVAAQSGSVIPCPARGRPERAVTWMDTRSRSLVESWPPEVAARIRALSGWMPTSGVGLSTIAALRASRFGRSRRWGPGRCGQVGLGGRLPRVPPDRAVGHQPVQRGWNAADGGRHPDVERRTLPLRGHRLIDAVADPGIGHCRGRASPRVGCRPDPGCRHPGGHRRPRPGLRRPGARCLSILAICSCRPARHGCSPRSPTGPMSGPSRPR